MYDKILISVGPLLQSTVEATAKIAEKICLED